MEACVHGIARVPVVHAVKSGRIFLPPEVTAAEAFRFTLQHCKRHVLANIPVVLEAHDAEGVHQLRVALRRLRVALAAFGEEFHEPSFDALRMRAKILARGLAPARDLDVFINDLFEPAAAANGSLEAFAVLRERAFAARREAWADASRDVSSPAFRTFLHDLDEAIDECLGPGNAQERLPALFARPASSLAARLLSRRFKMAKKRAKALDRLSETERHKLRIALKKLRYMAEFFAPLYPEKNVARFLKRLGRMQNILGLLQDVAVARATLKRLIDEEGVSRVDLSFAAGIVYGWHLDRAAAAWKDAVKRWKKLAGTEPFWARN